MDNNEYEENLVGEFWGLKEKNLKQKNKRFRIWYKLSTKTSKSSNKKHQLVAGGSDCFIGDDELPTVSRDR